ncbi:MAG: transferrin receptor-like dimerization domain-containing protein [Candidatus Korobacteraceae bacterium]
MTNRIGVSVLLFSLLQLGNAANGPESMDGYSPAHAAIERDWEAKFRNLPNPDTMKDSMQHLSARPHNVGSPYDRENAEWILSKFQQYGFDAHIETFDVLFPTPKERLVELVSPTHFVAKLQEPPLSIDPTSQQTSEQLPTYNAYSIDGDVTAPLVYVNYGMRDDYEQLDRLGVSVKGAIVIARYGGGWRGIKPKVAAEHGAVGCIIYSDPRDDGYFEGQNYPAGPYRPEEGVQRGSVMDTQYPGDPLTPGVGATKDAKRLSLKDAKTITTIPVLPISYGDAQPLLAAISGPTAPDTWRGALPITYRIGPGPGKVHLVVKSNWDLKTIYDVIAKIPGSNTSDQWVIRGNHHDAWVNGADDPISGMVVELEEARALGELVKQGWHPKRSIIYCAWDGEEPGLLGSTEWVEQHQDELRQHAVIYLNSDSSARGYLNVSGSHLLERTVNQVEREIQDPEKHLTVWKRAYLRRVGRASSSEDREELRDRADLRLGALGDGSDYTAFLDFAGVAALNMGFGGESGGGVYHSIYDDFYWYTHFGDTKFVYERALSQMAGSTVMRFADADLLPFDPTGSADTIKRYVAELKKELKQQQDLARERNREVEEGVFTATADPEKQYVPPPKQPVPPYLNFAPLENGVEAYARAAQRYRQAVAKLNDNAGAAWQSAGLQAINAKLLLTERTFTVSQGLKERPWFKHQIYAPGAYTGYGAKTIPAVREAMEEKKWQDADEGAVIVGQVLMNEASLVDSIAQELEEAEGQRPATQTAQRGLGKMRQDQKQPAGR